MRHMIFFLQLLWALFSLSNWIRGGEILMDFLRGSSHLLVCWFLMMIWNMNMKNGIFLRFMYIKYSKNVLFLLKKCIINDEYEVIQIRQCEIFFRKFLTLIYFIGHHYDFQIFTWACIFGAKSWYYLSFSNF